ncbi:MAG: hypothetical protein HYX68_19125 [Planctomycetes bacterium]|nr:hypothetical protein [Planctomycetota bacterium]
MTVARISNDTTTGLKWASGTISTGTDAVLNINGGDEAYNTWKGGIIGDTMMSGGYMYVNGGATLRISHEPLALAANIIIGQDGAGGSTLEFNGQTGALGVYQSAFIRIADTTDDAGPNRLLFSGDVTAVGTVSHGLQKAAGATNNPYIDNFGTIIRSNSGEYRSDLPIRNNSSYYPATLDLQSSFRISGNKDFTNTESYVSVYQAAGKVILRGASSLTCQGILMIGGDLQTYGGEGASLSKDAGYNGNLLTMSGGTITVSADDPSTYGKLTINGNLVWTGGTFQAYVNGGDEDERTWLDIAGNLTLGAGAHLNINSVGALSQGNWYIPIKYGGTRTNTLTFDSGDLFSIYYDNDSKAIYIHSDFM